MIDLSPQKNKEKIKKDFKLRLTIVFLIAFNIILVVYIVLILPTYFNLGLHKVDVKNRLDIEKKEFELRKGEDIKEQYTISKAKIRALNSIEKVDVHSIVSYLNDLSGDNTRILSFIYENKKDDKSIVISGLSKNRDTMVEFINKIKSSDKFNQVDFPISGLAKDSGLNFSLNIKLN